MNDDLLTAAEMREWADDQDGAAEVLSLAMEEGEAELTRRGAASLRWCAYLFERVQAEKKVWWCLTHRLVNCTTWGRHDVTPAVVIPLDTMSEGEPS